MVTIMTACETVPCAIVHKFTLPYNGSVCVRIVDSVVVAKAVVVKKLNYKISRKTCVSAATVVP